MNGHSGKLRRIRALVRKEMLQIMRDPSSALIAFVLPFILLFLFGYGVSLDTGEVRLGLVTEQPSSTTEELAAAFRGSRYFAVDEGRERREFVDGLTLGRVRGVVVVPADFTAKAARGESAPLQVLLDGTDPNTARFVQNYTRGTVAAWEAIRRAAVGGRSPAIAVQQRFWFNPELASRLFLVPGAIAVVMTVVGTILTSLVVAREWERGTMEAVMATPVTAGELFLGKFIPYFMLGLVSLTICFIVAVFLFEVPFRGSLAALYALSALFMLPTLGLGLLISTIAKNQFLASQIGLLAGFLPAFLLSGFVFEIGSMPPPIRLITQAVPARHLIPALQSVFLAGDIWPMFARVMIVLAAMGAALLSLAALKTRKRIE